MIIGVCTVDLKLYQSFSLKDKRKVVKSVTNKIKNKYNVSVSEVDNLDKWQLATITFANVGIRKTESNKVLNSILNFLEGFSDFETVNIDMEFL